MNWSKCVFVLMGKTKIAFYDHSPRQQVAAVLAARDFLLRLTRPAETLRVPGPVRQEARALLRHYPLEARLRPILEAGLLSPDVEGDSQGELASSPQSPQ
jgi:hypothetical protein